MILLLVLALCKLRYCLIIDFLSSHKRPCLCTSIVKSQNKAAARGSGAEPQKLTNFLESIAFLATNLLCGNDCGKPANKILKIIFIYTYKLFSAVLQVRYVVYMTSLIYPLVPRQNLFIFVRQLKNITS